MTSIGFSPVAVPPQLLAGPAAPTSAADLAKRGQIKETAQKFEASFLSNMLQTMFEEVDTGSFDGGQGETMFRSFLSDAMAKQVTKAGGIGISAAVQREMLKMQGLK